jgi:hypothetical protein
MLGKPRLVSGLMYSTPASEAAILLVKKLGQSLKKIEEVINK